MDATLKFYRDLLGFELKGKMEYSSNPVISDLVGAPREAQSRVQAGVVPGTNARIEFHEWKGLPRTPFNLRVADPGSPAVALRVTSLDGLLAKMKAAHVKIITAGGKPTEFGKNMHNIFVEDPSGFKIELYESTQ
jgi:catechol 2,3-dioxygenase-like lactoylglutathione lyase family enzyme